MRKLLICVLIVGLVVVGCSPISKTAPVQGGKIAQGLQLYLELDRKIYAQGEKPTVKVHIKNHNPEPVWFCISGCSYGLEYAYLNTGTTEETDSSGCVCDFPKSFKTEDFFQIKPGKSFILEQLNLKPMTEDTNKYIVWFAYSTDSEPLNCARDWWGEDRISNKAKKILQQVPKVKLTSNKVTVEVVEKEKE